MWKWKFLSLVWLFTTPWTIQSLEFSRPEYWRGQPFLSPGDLPNPRIEPRSSTLQADSSPAEHRGSPRILDWVAYSFSSGSSQPRNWTRISYIAGGFFTNWAVRKALGSSQPKDRNPRSFPTLKLQGIFPTQGSKPYLLHPPALERGFFTTSTTCED